MRKLLIILGLAIILVSCSNSTDIDGEKVTYEELQDKIKISKSDLEEIEGTISKAEGELEEIKNQISSNKEKYDELENLAKNEKNLKNEVSSKKDELVEIEKAINTKQDELDALQGELVKVKDEPIKVNAGYFYFGSDIEPGRYQVKPQGNGSGNFFVRGTNRVNIILGSSSDRHIREFTFEASDGDELETKLPVFLYPVE